MRPLSQFVSSAVAENLGKNGKVTGVNASVKPGGDKVIRRSADGSHASPLNWI